PSPPPHPHPSPTASPFPTPPAPPALHTPSLHDALPISHHTPPLPRRPTRPRPMPPAPPPRRSLLSTPTVAAPWPSCRSAISSKADRKSTRLNSSHVSISYAVFCLKKKKTDRIDRCGSDA